MFCFCSLMSSRFDLEVGGVGFIAMEACDIRMVRRGGVVIWARRTAGGWRPLAVCEARIISLLAGSGPAEADCLLISPPITDGRRLRGVRSTVEAALRMTVADARSAA